MRKEITLGLEHDAPGYFFPGWIPTIWKNRTLAYYVGNSLVTEHGQSTHITSYSELFSELFAGGLLTLCTSLLDFPWLEEAVTLYKGMLYATPKGIPTALCIQGKANGHTASRWLIQASTWQQHTPNDELLQRLRMLFEHCGVGTANTPAALGMLLQKRAFYEQYGDTWVQHRHPLPPERCVKDLRERSSGARSDLLASTTETFDLVYELDAKNAYAAAFEEVPTGPTVPHQGNFLEQYQTYVSQCHVEIREPLVLGCFPVRTEQAGIARVEYPRQIGQYDAFLWREEIDRAREKGCIVTTGPGWGWVEMTRDNAHFARLMTELRDTAPPEIVDWIKIAIVGSIGRHGSPWQSTILLPEEEASPGDRPAAWDGLAYDWVIHEACFHIPETMQHWFSYTLMKCRLTLYQYALPFAEEGTLLASNVDAVYVARETLRARHVIEKHLAYGLPAGTWRKTTLTEVQFPALRHLVSHEKVRRPGVPP